MARPKKASTVATKNDSFRFIGHNACLDFINTEEKKSGKPFDLLRDFDDFVRWLACAKLFQRDDLNSALENSSPQDFRRIFEDALALRAALGELATEIVEGRSIPQRALGVINRLIAIPLGTTKLIKTPRGFERQFQTVLKEPDQLLVPIAESAAQLLCSGNFPRVKRCANSECGAFFYDTSKNHGRRWCAATGCGNRMRVAAYYERQRS